MEFNNKKEWTAVKVVITVVGVDRTGIIAAVSQIMAENKVNILTINQVILDGILTWP